MSDDDIDEDDLPTVQSGVDKHDRAQFTLQALMSNGEGEIVLVQIQNDVFATVNEKGKLTVTTPDGKQPYTRTYPQQPQQLFLDPTGNHLLVSFMNGDLEYVNLVYRKHDKIALSSSVSTQLLSSVPLLGGVAPSSLPATAFVVTAVGWDHTNTAVSTTGTILCGSREGTLYELRVEVASDGGKPQAAVKPLVTGGEWAFTEPIRGIAVERFPALRKVVVLVSSARRLLRWSGDWTPTAPGAPGASLKSVLDAPNRPLETSKPASGELSNNGAISVYRSNLASPAVSFAWNSSIGIYHGLFANNRDAVEPTTLSLIPFGHGLDPQGPFAVTPLDVTLTPYHMVLTYIDKVVLLLAPAGLPWVSNKASVGGAGGSSGFGPSASSSSLSTQGGTRTRGQSMLPTRTMTMPRGSAAGAQAREAPLTAADFNDRQRYAMTFGRRGTGRCGLHDVAKRKTFAACSGFIFEVEARHEHRSAWRVFLERALDTKEDPAMRERCFAAATKLTERFAKNKTSLVRWCRGIFYSETSRFSQATDHFAQCDRFEAIFDFLSRTASRNTLIDYLEKRLLYVERELDAKNQPRNAQIACLEVVTLQLHLERYAAADSENDVKRNECFAKLKFFLLSRTAHINAVNLPAFYNVFHRLLAAHGRTEALLTFAEAMKKYRFTVAHHINRKEYKRACETLKNTCQTPPYASIWYEFAPRLVQHVPCALFEGFESCLVKEGRQFRSFLRPESLIPAFVSYNVRDNEDEFKAGEHLTLDYLQSVLGANSLPVVWNYYMSLCLKHDPKSLEKALQRADACYTQEFVLRKCLDSDDPLALKCCVYLYKQMGLIEEAVRIAVSANEVETAKRLVREGTLDAATKKKLWRQIAELVAEKNEDPKAVLDVVKESSGYLLLEDVLGVLAKQNTVLGIIKEAICANLDDYSERIKLLEEQMQEATSTAQEIKQDENRLMNQFGYITASQRCDLCGRPLLQNLGAAPFLLFPSCAHAFHEHCIDHLYAAADRERITLVAHELGLDDAEASGAQFAALIRDADCPTCGEFAIAQIADPYFDERDTEADMWSVT
jgi:hypothetical protein